MFKLTDLYKALQILKGNQWDIVTPTGEVVEPGNEGYYTPAHFIVANDCTTAHLPPMVVNLCGGFLKMIETADDLIAAMQGEGGSDVAKGKIDSISMEMSTL